MVTEDEADALPYTWWLQRMKQTSYRTSDGYWQWSRRLTVHLVVTDNEADVLPYTWRLQRMKQTSYRTPDGYRGWSRLLTVHQMVTEDEADFLLYTWWLQRMKQTSYRTPSWHRRLRESRESEQCNPQTGSSRPAETRTCLPVTQSVRCWARNPATLFTRFWSDHHVVYCVDWLNRGLILLWALSPDSLLTSFPSDHQSDHPRILILTFPLAEMLTWLLTWSSLLQPVSR